MVSHSPCGSCFSFEVARYLANHALLPVQVEEKRKYAKFRALYIAKCIKEGTRPEPPGLCQRFDIILASHENPSMPPPPMIAFAAVPFSIPHCLNTSSYAEDLSSETGLDTDMMGML